MMVSGVLFNFLFYLLLLLFGYTFVRIVNKYMYDPTWRVGPPMATRRPFFFFFYFFLSSISEKKFNRAPCRTHRLRPVLKTITDQ